MISPHNITSIAKYEITTLLRSWFFRIFAILAMISLFVYNLATLMLSGNGPSWNMVAIPSAIPYVNLLILNTVQAIIAIFLASDFLKRDKKLDTTDVIYIRSMSNGEYVAGKTLGNIIVFTILNVIILAEALIFNLMVDGVVVDWMAYLSYYLLISLPTLIFILGLSFFIMSVLKNQAITFIILLGYVAVTIFYLNTKYYYLFDYMAYSIPLLKSDFIGFGNLPAILIHRGMYTCFGVAFIFLTVSLLKRLPQSRFSNKVTLLPAIIFFVGGIWLGKMHVSSFVNNQEMRENMRALNDKNIDTKRLKVNSYQINVSHEGDKLDITAKVGVENTQQEPIDHFVFSLNPGLKLKGVKYNGQAIDAKQDLQLIEFSGTKLQPSESAEIEFSYSGKPNEAACYLDVADKTLEEPFKVSMYQIDKRYAIVSPDYVLLTRESNWYPVAGTGFGEKSKQWVQKQFSKYELTVKTKSGLTAISQGVPEQKEGEFHFTNKQNLSQISLVIGKYDVKSQVIDGLTYSLYNHKDHDYFTKFFEPIKDTIPELIKEAMADYERTLDMFYPFSRVNLIEVPAQFVSYPRTFIGERDQIQPETILFPEKGLQVDAANFSGFVKRMERAASGGGFGGGGGGRGMAETTPEQKKIMSLTSFFSTFTQETERPSFNMMSMTPAVAKVNPLYFYPLFYNYAYFVQSEKWPIADRIFESYLKQSSSSTGMNVMMGGTTGMTEDEQANLALLDNSFDELLNDADKVQIIDNIVQLKGQTLFSIIKRKAGDDAFTDFMYNYLKSIKFNTGSIEDFSAQINQKFNADLLPFMDKWFKSKELPGYLIGTVTAVSLLDGDRQKTMVKFKVTNTESTEGIILSQFRLGFGGGGFGRAAGANNVDNISKLLYLEGHQTKEVSYLLEGTPFNITINTLTSKNIPAVLNIPLMNNIKEDNKAIPYEGEQTSDVPVRMAEDNEYIADDEDSTFKYTETTNYSLLQRILLKDDVDKERFVAYNTWRAPRSWKSTTNSSFFGKYIRSAHFIKSGDGNKKAVWKVVIPAGGNYEVYTYLVKIRGGGQRGPGGGGGGQRPAGGGGTGGGGGGGGPQGMGRGNETTGEYTYTIYHNNEKEQVTVNLQTADEGWNNLGTYFFTGDTVKIELSNKSESQVVVADAVKLVKQ
jgi:ABC-type transport system involved in multi-copper enzyme maturation permease subunit